MLRLKATNRQTHSLALKMLNDGQDNADKPPFQRGIGMKSLDK
jgi:hypothetical protein